MKSQITITGPLSQTSRKSSQIEDDLASCSQKLDSLIVNSNSNVSQQSEESSKSTGSILFDEETPVRLKETVTHPEVTAKPKTSWLKKVVPHRYYDYRESKKRKKIEKYTKQLQNLALVH